MTPRTILALETSCDETAAALLCGTRLLSSEIASQTAIHEPFGGVVPEVASRNHLRAMRPVMERTLRGAQVEWDAIDAFAATRGPGLATSLMIGLATAKALAVGFGKPFVAVNHLEGHLLSPFFSTLNSQISPVPDVSQISDLRSQISNLTSVEPSVALVVSGGHTLLVEIRGVGEYRLLGQTCDDAAGEAFDKVGKLLGLPYPGGPHVNRLAGSGQADRYDFPRSMLDSGDFNFSFSGLKTSVRTLLPKLRDGRVEDLCASFQEAVVDVLVAKTVRAAEKTGRRLVALSGGVSCNSRLRERMGVRCEELGLRLLIAEPALCTDNAVMIGFAAALKLAAGESSPLTADIDPNLPLVP